MAFVEIEINSKDFENRLGDMKHKMPSISRKMMNKVNNLIKKETRKSMRARKFDTSKENGIYKNLYSYAKKDFSAKIGIKRNANYAIFVENGVHIEPKKYQYLTFKVNGNFVKVKSVTIPARPFLKPAVEMYWKTNKANTVMEEVFQKELDKLFRG